MEAYLRHPGSAQSQMGIDIAETGVVAESLATRDMTISQNWISAAPLLLACLWVAWSFHGMFRSFHRGLKIGAENLAKPVTEEVTVYMAKGALYERLAISAVLIALIVFGWGVPFLGTFMLWTMGSAVLLILRKVLVDWAYLRPNRAPVLYLSATGMQIRNEVRFSWAQVSRVEVHSVGFGRARTSYLALELKDPWRIGALARNPLKRCEYCRRGLPKGDYVLPLVSLEEGAFPGVVLALIQKRIATPRFHG